MAKQKINPSQQLNTVLTQTNTGTAGGTINYINLGGIKMAWGTTASQSSGNPGTVFTVIPPTSFFSTIVMANSSSTYQTAIVTQSTPIASFAPTLIEIYFSTSTAATQKASWFVIGT